MFYTFHQNNSGGSFEETATVSVVTIVEARTADLANAVAQSIGIYFYGCFSGIDCTCCGDRWSQTYEAAGRDVPCLYGKPITECEASFFDKKAIVHYADGRVETVIFAQKPKAEAIGGAS